MVTHETHTAVQTGLVEAATLSRAVRQREKSIVSV